MLLDPGRVRSVTRIPSGLPYAWQRYGKYAVNYAIVLLVLTFIPIWKFTDLWLFSAVIGLADGRTQPSSIMLDLDAKRGEVRRKLTAKLNAIPLEPSPPKAIVIDVALMAAHGEDGLRAALERLHQKVKIFGAVDSATPDAGPADAQRDDALYADGHAFSGLGHVLLQAVSHLPSDRVVGYYRVTEPIVFSGSPDPMNVRAMAMMVNPDPQKRDEIKYFWTGPRTYPLTSDSPPDYRDRVVIIGNNRTQATDSSQFKRSGMELLAWAIDDVTATATQANPFFEVPIMWLVTAMFSCMVVLTFVAIWRVLKTRTFALPLTYLISFVLTFAAMLGFDYLLFTFNQIFTELTLVVLGIFTGGAIAYVWCFETMRHERFLRGVWAAATGEERYDYFISYARTPENLAWVKEHVVAPLKLAKRPDGTPVRVFFDSDSIATGTDFYNELVKGIYSSRFFVPIYSTAYFNRYYCRDEIAFAMLRRETVTDFIKPLSRLRWMWLAPRPYARIQCISVTKQPNFIDDILRWMAGKESA